jgi:hypothetical protein
MSKGREEELEQKKLLYYILSNTILINTKLLTMIVLRVVLLLICCILMNARYSLYHSDIDKISYQAYDCLYEHFIRYYPSESGKFYNLNSQLTPYCRRPDDDDDENNNNEKEEKVSYETGENIANIIPFNELKKQGVTSEQLLAWSAPIDVVEKY